jgi:hypothetical protein
MGDSPCGGCSSDGDSPPKAKAVSRERFKGCPLEASKLVGPFLTSPTALEYDDDFSEARVQPKLILKMQAMWEKVKHDVQPNLVFFKYAARKIFEHIVAEKTSWGFDDKTARAWASTVGERFRAQGCHINKAMQKCPQT